MKAHLFPEQELKRRAMSWALRLKVNPAALRFEDLKDRWGYCSPAGEVTLALDLVGKDEPFQDYVIVHELLHIRVRSHGKRFTALLSAYIPDWRDLERAMAGPGPNRCEVRRAETGRNRSAAGDKGVR
jgi:predicted metal-dependent hydrolase